MLVNADLHIHSRFSGGVSASMDLKTLSIESKKKGIQLLGTGDCLHPTWLSEIKQMEEVDEGTFELNGMRFVLTDEIEDTHRVHHLVIFPSISAVEDMYERLKFKSNNIRDDGRPHVFMEGWDIAEMAKDVGALIGPCHAFTPWTGMYGTHDSLKSCYGDMADYVSFLELGLSADSDYADRISELHRLTFLSNSDAHSPYPFRLAREFNRFDMEDISFEELKMAILREKGRKPVLNVGLPPEEGKYNETACVRCYHHFSLEEAKASRWKCPFCGGRIKKGVKDRVNELADLREPKHPEHRPPYLKLIPLAEIISMAFHTSSPMTKKVQREWETLINRFGNEVNVLVDATLEEVKKVASPEVGDAIERFRTGRIYLRPGGGGQYGKISLEPLEDVNERRAQKTLFDF